MASDPSMRGLTGSLSLILRGANGNPTTPQDLRMFIRALADARMAWQVENGASFPETR
jgi:hypothetical protein